MLVGLGCWLLAAGYWPWGVGFWPLAFGSWLLALGFWLLVLGGRGRPGEGWALALGDSGSWSFVVRGS